jgi:quercetin 2,3-dioxygenase
VAVPSSTNLRTLHRIIQAAMREIRPITRPLGPGDVQWLTAGHGILHEEFHSAAFTRTGGPFRMVQLWVNLPAKDKMSPPGYQSILDADIPSVDVSAAAG